MLYSGSIAESLVILQMISCKQNTMKKIIILIFAVLLATFFYAYEKIDYNKFIDKWGTASLEKLKIKGDACIQNGHTDSALVLYTIIINKYRSDIPREEQNLCASAMNNAAYIYMFNHSNYSEAYTNLLRAQHIAEDNGIKELLPYIYLNVGNIYTIYYDNKTAVKYFKKSFYSSIDVKDWNILLTVFTNLVGTAIQEGRINSVRNELAVFRRLNIPKMPMLRYSRLMCSAADYLLKDNNGMAVDCLRQAAAAVDSKLQPKRYRLFVNQLEAIVLGNSRRYKDALALSLKVERESESEAPDIQEQMRSNISMLYGKLGEADSALFWQERRVALSDTIFRNQRYSQIRDLNVAYEMQNANMKLLHSENKRHTIMVAFIVTLFAAVIIFVLVLILINKNRRLNISNHDLYRRNGEIMRMNDNERKLRTEYEQRIAECEREIKSLTEKDVQTVEPKQSADAMDEAVRQSLLEKINNVLDDVSEISKNEFSIGRLSKLISSNSHYVSQVINETYGKNFSTVLGEARVRQACRRLSDIETYGNLTIEAIAGELGFKSRSNFVTVFKKITGLTPSEYKKISREKFLVDK